MRTRTPLAAAVVLAVTIGAAAAAPAETSRGADQKITAAGVGKVKLGKTFRSLRAAGLVGRMRPGCPLSGTDTRSARLKPPLEGMVNLTTRRRPRTVRDISITGGATARGVGVGDTISDIRAAFPEARVDHATDDVFGITLVKIPRDGGGRIQFAVDVGTKTINRIGVPILAFCE